MPISLSVKNVPDRVAELLRKRAEHHHRSLQGELVAILEEAADSEGRRVEIRTVDDLARLVADLGLRTEDDAGATLRAERNSR